jgi:hypothetical protein
MESAVGEKAYGKESASRGPALGVTGTGGR